jgi:Helix-turn-helix of DDE superfamily endonuclease
LGAYCQFYVVWHTPDSILMSVSKKPLLLRSFTVLEISEFNTIYKDIESAYKHERKRLSGRKRERKVGAGRPFKLKVKERFLMLLVYYRLYITYTLSGFLFDLDQSNVCRDICVLEPLVKWYAAGAKEVV